MKKHSNDSHDNVGREFKWFMVVVVVIVAIAGFLMFSPQARGEGPVPGSELEQEMLDVAADQFHSEETAEETEDEPGWLSRKLVDFLRDEAAAVKEWDLKVLDEQRAELSAAYDALAASESEFEARKADFEDQQRRLKTLDQQLQSERAGLRACVEAVYGKGGGAQ